MPIQHNELTLLPLPGALPAWRGEIAAQWLPEICSQVCNGGGRLVALWGSDMRDAGGGFLLQVTLVNERGLVCLDVPLATDHPHYPDISGIFPAAARMQRATYDLLGLHADGAHDHRKWLRHAAWYGFPLRKDFDAANQPLPLQEEVREMVASGTPHPAPLPQTGERTNENGNLESLAEGTNAHAPAEHGDQTRDDYPFVRVKGLGVHEIAVGPVHAGIIEPGHFRFSVIGERVLWLEERFGYVHKGIEKCFEGMDVQQGARLAGRVSGDSTVAYAWAYAMAAENMAAATAPDHALWLRALLLERERVANHLGDLGYLGNEVAFAFGFAQFWILKEQVLRHNAELFGHRYLMDSIVPGGVTVNLDRAGMKIIEQECALLAREVGLLRNIYDEHAGVQERFISTGRVLPKLAAELGLCGLAGRASAQAWDARAQFACAPYDKLDVQMATQRNGDVAARVAVRFDELFESLRLQREILIHLVGEDTHRALDTLPPQQFGIGMVEGWRGEVLVAMHSDAGGKLARVHAHDPSWQNWPVLGHAILDNIVPDFPLINKSFNLSYSGQDL